MKSTALMESKNCNSTTGLSSSQTLSLYFDVRPLKQPNIRFICKITGRTQLSRKKPLCEAKILTLQPVTFKLKHSHLALTRPMKESALIFHTCSL